MAKGTSFAEKILKGAGKKAVAKIKLIRAVKNPQTGGYAFKAEMVDPDKVKEALSR